MLRQALMLKTLDSMRSVKSTLEKIDSRLRIHHHGIKDYKSNVSVEFERSHYSVRTARNGAELEECLKLRFQVFHREYLNKRRRFGVDVDKLDLICDHLMILDNRTGRVIGTYRLNCSRFTEVFYSTAEFHMDQILELPGHKLEMGRACIDKDHRNGAIIALLWRGIAEYIVATESRYLFGCASVKTMEVSEIAMLTRYLKDEDHLTEEYGVRPTKKFDIPVLNREVEKLAATEYPKQAVAALIPTLFNSYIRAGARVCGSPALDKDFRCIDYLILLKIADMNPLFVRKYKV